MLSTVWLVNDPEAGTSLDLVENISHSQDCLKKETVSFLCMADLEKLI